MNRRLILTWAVMGALLAGCGIPSQQQLALPAVAPSQARLIFYRTAGSPYDGLIWTRVSLNGVAVGDSGPGTVFYRDVPPGTYDIEARSEKLYPHQSKTVVAAPGSTTFVKIVTDPYWDQYGVDWRSTTFIVAIIDPAIGQYEIGPLRFRPG